VAFAESMVPKMMDYLRGNADLDPDVVKFASPTEIAAAFEKVSSVSLNFDEQAQPVDHVSLTKAADVVCDYSVRTTSPGFHNQLYGGIDASGMVGDWLATMLNTNVFTYEVAPVFTLMEHSVINKFARVLGGGFTDGECDGMMLPGGSMANMYSMHLARYKVCPETKTGGNAAAPAPLVAFTSDESHYSYLKSANLMGLGTEQMVKVPCDEETGAMNAIALDEMLTAEKARGQRLPFFVGATAGTTVLGAFDPFRELAAVCAKHNVWLHVDGAWGGAALLSSRHNHLTDGINLADSFSCNPHKSLGAPLQTTIFMTASRHRDRLRAANSANAAYLFQPDKNYGDLDIGDKTLQCGRKCDALKMWMMWKRLGDDGLEKRVNWNSKLIEYMTELICTTRDSQGRRCFMLTSKQQYCNLLFYLIPPSMRDDVSPSNEPNNGHADDTSKLSDEQAQKLGRVSAIVKDRMQRRGLGLIGFQPIKKPLQNRTLSNCWRMVIAGAREETMDEEHIDKLVSDMLRVAEDVTL
jgi:glutamate/tyrosine decarboxylase-like PLP-dependent enzyme